MGYHWVEVMKKVKRVFDPNNVLNPGGIFRNYFDFILEVSEKENAPNGS
ncbi:MAG: FAD-linked oxidase C-terminal domain-containing protein [Pseudomonadota bacterium]